jgi:hypothetical protein
MTSSGSALRPYDFVITFDASGTPAVCLDKSTSAGVITTNFAPNGTSVQCVTSAHAPGLVDVTADNGDESSTLTDAYEYTRLYYIKIMSDKTSATVDVSPTTTGATATDHLTLTTETNWENGFTLDIKQGTAGATLTCDSGASTGTTLPVTTDNVATLDLNRWGVGVGTSNTEPTAWHNVTSSAWTLDSLAWDGSKTTHLYYGARFNYSQPACEYYSGSVNIIASVVP